MHNSSDPRWRNFWQNLIWFAATLIVLIILFRFTFSSVVLLALWGVGLVWGGVLAYKLSQILLGNSDIALSREQSQDRLAQAYSYRQKINGAIKNSSDASGLRAGELSEQVDKLVNAIEELVERTNALRQDEVIMQDIQAVPQSIADLQTRLAGETDPVIKRQLERTLRNRQQQQESLETLQKTIRRAEIQVESSLSQLGTIYSQLLTGQSTSDVADYSRLAADVDEEVHLLQDQLEALQEVKLGGAE